MSVRFVSFRWAETAHVGVDVPQFGGGSRFALLCGGSIHPQMASIHKAPTCKACVKQVERLHGIVEARK